MIPELGLQLDKYTIRKSEGETDRGAIYITLRIDKDDHDHKWTRICRNVCRMFSRELVKERHCQQFAYDLVKLVDKIEGEA